MYAVIASGGKQYRVEEGQVIGLEKLPQEEGEKINFDQVLMVSDGENVSIGAPYVDKAKVSAEIVSQERAKKIDIIKFKRRKQHMKHQGHRQYITKVKITGISAAGMSKAKTADKPKAAAKPKAKAEPTEAAAKPAKSKPKASASKKDAPAKEKKAEE